MNLNWKAKAILSNCKLCNGTIYGERDEKSKLMEQNHILNERINKLHEDKGSLISKCEKKERIISELNWYRCEMNRCPYRKPPRKYGDFDLPENAIIPEGENEN